MMLRIVLMLPRHLKPRFATLNKTGGPWGVFKQEKDLFLIMDGPLVYMYLDYTYQISQLNWHYKLPRPQEFGNNENETLNVIKSVVEF